MVYTGPVWPREVNDDSPFFTVRLVSSYRRGNVRVISKGLIFERTKNSFMFDFIIQLSAYMIWMITCGSVATAIIPKVTLGSSEVHGESKSQEKWQLPIPIGHSQIVNQIHISKLTCTLAPIKLAQLKVLTYLCNSMGFWSHWFSTRHLVQFLM